jgi:hypothetical protein
MRKHQSGNVFFFIFIAVFLFGALSAAVLNSQSSGRDARDEQLTLAAGEIIEWGSQVEQAVQRLQARGCSIDDIDFGNSVSKNTNGTDTEITNTNAPSDGSCSVFHPNGGGITAKVFTKYVATSDGAAINATFGHWEIQNARIEGLGNDLQSELTLRVMWLSNDLCMKINDILGVPNDTNTALHAGGTGGALTDESNGLEGKTRFCAQWHQDSVHNFYWQTLLIR